jgi:two-component system cell cycle response regulator DivK
MLEKLGHQTVVALGGMEGIKAALAQDPDVILMDLSMPEIDGLVATAALRTISSFVKIPIVATTAFPERLSRTAALAAGCNVYLEKPLILEDLARVLKQFQKGAA